MDKTRKCDNCGELMVYKCDSSIQGWYCMKCDWNIVTSNIQDIYQDTKEYIIYSNKHDNVTKDQIKVLAQVTGENYIKAKNILSTENKIICKGKAVVIKEVIKKLEENSIFYKVEPDFKY